MTAPRKGWIATASGRSVNVLAPAAEDITIEDIAHALGNLSRWGGHSTPAISVAQHSVMVSFLVPPEFALWGLLHDASEAYLVDVPKPIKVLDVMAPYRAVEALVQKTIYIKFGCVGDEPAEVKAADLLAASAEAIDLFPRKSEWWAKHLRDGTAARAPGPIVPWSPTKSARVFLNRFEACLAIKLKGRNHGGE